MTLDSVKVFRYYGIIFPIRNATIYKCDFAMHKNVWFHVHVITVTVFLKHNLLGNNMLCPCDLLLFFQVTPQVSRLDPHGYKVSKAMNYRL